MVNVLRVWRKDIHEEDQAEASKKHTRDGGIEAGDDARAGGSVCLRLSVSKGLVPSTTPLMIDPSCLKQLYQSCNKTYIHKI